MARDLRGVFGWSRPYRAGVRASTIGDHLYFHSA